MPKMKKIEDLRKQMSQSETADKFLFSEQRSNILLIAGDHYTKRNSKYWNRLRETRYLTQDQKLRLTKNHIQKIHKTYVNAITNHAPGVRVLPNNEKENADRKSAELNNAVWQYGVARHKLTERITRWADDFCGIGEVFVKLTWNEEKGEVVGYQQKVGEDGQPMFEQQQGPPVVDPMTGMQYPGEMMQGEPIADESKPVFSGDMEFKRIFGFNIRRPNGVQNLDDAEWLAEVDLVHINKVKRWVGDDPEKQRQIREDTYEQFYVFDGNMNGYDYKKDHTKVTSMYYRPSAEYPNGYYYIFTNTLILFEGELPFGIFPIVYKGFDSIQTSPRHRSIIKQLRPYQVEINRCASKIAEHQVTLGDDKLLVQSGTKITQGINLPGVRAMQYTGREPIILAGRSGEQYVNYMQSQIEEMYNVSNVPSEQMEKGGQDPFASLFQGMRQKKKFSLYAEKFERFLIDVCELYLTLAKNYYDEGRLIPMVGKSEHVNISEFKNSEPLNYQIKLEPQVQDIETQYGKQLAINHAMQYVGSNLEKGDIGRMMRAMPFGNFEEGFEDFTIDYDLAQNLMLALDRGEQPTISPYDEPVYIIKMLVNRIRQPDFQLLDPQIQQNYMGYKQYYEQLEVQNQNRLLAAQADFIPTGGPKIKVDFYIPKPGSPDKSERATLPAEAVNWLVERLADQGSNQESLKDLNQGAAADVAGAYLQQRGKDQGQE